MRRYRSRIDMPLHTKPEVDVDDDKRNPSHRALGEKIQTANSTRNFAICLWNVSALFEAPVIVNGEKITGLVPRATVMA